ncbi:hypothetical protein TSAR_012306, partial [Trichomalopsis sarcophagae]
PLRQHSSRANRELDISVNPCVASAVWFTAIFLILISQLLESVPRHSKPRSRSTQCLFT